MQVPYGAGAACRTGARGGATPQLSCLDAGGEAGKAVADAAQPIPDQHDQRPRQRQAARSVRPPAGNLRGHIAAQQIHDERKTPGRGGGKGQWHGRRSNTTGTEPGKRNFSPAAGGRGAWRCAYAPVC